MPLRERSDQALVVEALEGHQAAYGEIVRRFERPLFSLIVRMVRDRERAEDLCQEAFVKAFRALPSYDPRRKFSSWLFKIGHNATIDSLRRLQLDTTPLEAGEDELGLSQVLPDLETPSPHRTAYGHALGAAIERAVERLRPEYREAFLLRFAEGMAYQEIAEIMDLPMGTVKTNLHRARKEFATLLEEEGFDG
jgi:RNA polymerase sigma-70 factor (ECF subfamily)